MSAAPAAKQGWATMVPIPGGTFLMGSEDFYPEERPVRRSAVDGFWMDETAVTSGGVPPLRSRDRLRHGGRAAARPGRLSGRRSGAARARLARLPQADRPGAARRRSELVGVRPGRLLEAPPAGPGSTINGRDRHPVVQVAYEDAEATPPGRARRCRPRPSGSTPPAGASRAPLRLGRRARPGGKPMANTWQGEFPWQNLKEDGFEGTSPVGSFPPNGYGLYDMCGQRLGVDERLVRDDDGAGGASAPCCAPPTLPGEQFPRKVIKGGSHLCAPNYCLRYRPAARRGETVDTSTAHIGFRCVVREAP